MGDSSVNNTAGGDKRKMKKKNRRIVLPFVTLDVFTSKPFSGNSLAVVYLNGNNDNHDGHDTKDKGRKDDEDAIGQADGDEEAGQQDRPQVGQRRGGETGKSAGAGALARLTHDQKQLIAREFNLSETVFVHASPHHSNSGSSSGSSSGGGGDDGHGTREVALEIFTPTEELPFAGHPTIGTICALHARSGPSLASPAASKEPVVISGALRAKAGRIPYTYTQRFSGKEDYKDDDDDDEDNGIGDSGSGSEGTATATIPHDVHIHTQLYSRRDFFTRQQPGLAALEHTFRADKDDEINSHEEQQEQQGQQRKEVQGSIAGSVGGGWTGEARQLDELRVTSICNGLNFLLVRLPSLEWLAKVDVAPERVMPRLDAGWDDSFTACYFWVDVTEAGDGDSADGAGGDSGIGAGASVGIDNGAGGRGPAATETSAAEAADATRPLQLRLRTRMIEGPLEDAATGSAACTLAAFLALRAARSVHAEIVQGVEMGKESHIAVEVDLKRRPSHKGDNHGIDGGGGGGGGDGGSGGDKAHIPPCIERVRLSGSAVQVMRGEIAVASI